MYAGQCGSFVQDEHASVSEVRVGKLADVVQDAATGLH